MNRRSTWSDRKRKPRHREQINLHLCHLVRRWIYICATSSVVGSTSVPPRPLLDLHLCHLVRRWIYICATSSVVGSPPAVEESPSLLCVKEVAKHGYTLYKGQDERSVQ
ncbi:hypothetical protein JTE90_024367 [Oedothorax gibbosus]|uniref:Uncharacterized protein n=1 Tax=Oedothorax gibbosus TaxID=931172 RepID=A0AAV6W0E4_9ARAC|nr:hypothetical protein JTE90_024367 [Oedothorax gibbosus]